MESLDDRLARIEREAENIPQLDRLSDQALRDLLSQHIEDLCRLGNTLASKPFAEVVHLAQSTHGVLGMVLRECELRGRVSR